MINCTVLYFEIGHLALLKTPPPPPPYFVSYVFKRKNYELLTLKIYKRELVCSKYNDKCKNFRYFIVITIINRV